MAYKDEFSEYLRLWQEGKYTLLSRANTTHWHAPINALVEKSGINPMLMLLDTPLLNALSLPLPKSPRIVFTSGIMKAMGTHSLHQPPSKELLAVFAHEMSHLKDGLEYTLGKHYMPQSLAAGAVAALYLYRRAHKGTPAETLESMDRVAAQQMSPINNDMPEEARAQAAHSNQLMQMGMYLAAGALGFGGGKIAQRYMSRADEFRADRMAAEWLGDVDAAKSMLNKLYKTLKENFSVIEKTLHVPDEKEFFARVSQQTKQFWTQVEYATRHAHPSLNERLAALDALKLPSATPHPRIAAAIAESAAHTLF